MANRRKLAKIGISALVVLLALTMVLSAGLSFFRDTASEANSLIKQWTGELDYGLDRYYNSSVIYKLPDKVKDTDSISVIIRTKKASLLDAWEAGNRTLTFNQYVFSEAANPVKEAIEQEKAELLSMLDNAGVAYETGADYRAIFGGFEVIIKAGDFETLGRTIGKRATPIVGEEYLPAKTQLVENVVNVYGTGIFNSSSFGYDGTGTVVAVLDTGLDYTHTAFSVNNFTADQSKLGMTFADVEGFISDTKASKLYAGLTASDVYVNVKVPYAFDYADGDPDVYPMTPDASEHGTHVAGVIAGKDQEITGVAPNAQLAIMKIFSDVVSTARSSWILSALEDCAILGVDVINMSIGTSCGFSRESDKNNEREIYDRIREAGISMVVAASNSFNSTYGSEKNGNLGLTSNPDSATVGSPSTYEGAMSVASISGTKTPYLLYGDTIIYFTESNNRIQKEKSFYDDILGDKSELEIEYITIPGVGRSADYAGIDVTGKVVLVRRGATTFEEKANVAQQKGAAGIIIYNNVSGDIKMNVGDTTIGVCSIGQDDGELLAAAGSGKIKLARSQTSGPFMSDFSSWGPTPDLGIKPEITAHGGMIYSAVPGQEYDRQSGTSMACPNVAGVTALLRQYVRENFSAIKDDNVAIAKFVNQLMMSTADIVYNTNGLPYAVRKQGAGLASLDNVAKTMAYIITYREDGSEMDKTKLELGDDPTKTGVYTMTFGVHNFGSASITYNVSAIVMTEGVSETLTNQGETTVDEQGYLLSGATVEIIACEGATQQGSAITVTGGSTASVTVRITLSDADKQYMDASFENGMYVEGFIVLDDQKEGAVDLSVPYLAFYGDWTQAPLFDLDYYATNKDELDDSIDLLDKTLPDAYATRPIGGVQDDYVSYLGSYYFVQDPSATQIAADRKYVSLSNQVGAIHELSAVWGGMLRNAQRMEITITDDVTGEVIFERTNYDIRKSYGDGGSIYPANIEIDFDAYEANLKNNTTYTVTIKGYLDYGDGGESTNANNVFTFPITADFQAPAVTDCEFYTEYDRTAEKTRLFAKIAVYDNHHAMSLQIGYVGTSEDGAMLQTFDQYLTPVYSERNSTSYVVYELTDYVDDIKRNALNKNCFTVAAYDYALNVATYEIALPDDFTAFYFAEESMTLSPNQVVTLDPMVYPKTEWSQLLDFVSTNQNVARIVGNKMVTVGKGDTVIIARFTDKDGKVQQITMPVKVLGKGDPGYVEYDKPVTDSFQLTGYLTNKAYYFVNSDERDIGSTGDEMKFTGNHYALSMYPSESVTLRYSLVAYFPNDVEVVAESSNESLVSVTKVNGEWVITAKAQGFASVSVSVLMDGRSTYYAQSISIEVKDPYVTQGPALSHYYGNGGRVEIPASLSLTSIGAFAFSNFEYVAKGAGDEISEEDPTTMKQWYIGDNTITEIIIPEGVETISSYAFAKLTKLTRVELPSTLTRIDFGAFAECTSLTEVVGLENVKFINRDAFYGTAIEEIKLDNTVAIADYAFSYCRKLTSVTLGEGLRSVGAAAFAYCTSLTDIEIKADVIKLGENAFDHCSSLTEIKINAAVIPTMCFNECVRLSKITLGPDVAVIGEYAFSNVPATSFTLEAGNSTFVACDGGKYLTNKAGDTLLLVAPGVSGTLTINNEAIKTIGTAALSGNVRIREVVIPSVTNVQSYAFAYCESLRSVTLGTLTKIGDYAFYRTSLQTLPSFEALSTVGAWSFAYTKITDVNVPDNFIIGNSAFRECAKLQSVTIGDNVTVGAYAFALSRENNYEIKYDPSYRDENGKLIYFYVYTSALEQLTIGDNAKLGTAAFMGAAILEHVTLGNGAVIGDEAFYNAVSLKSIDLSFVKRIGRAAFSGDVLYEFDSENMSSPSFNAKGEYRYRYYAPALTSVVLNSATGIGEDAFAYCLSLVSVTLGDQITDIPARAFDRCTALASINLENVKTVGENAFYESALTSVVLTSAKEIGKYAFVYCSDLTTVTLAQDVRVLEGAFAYCSALSTVLGDAGMTFVGDYAFVYTAITSADLTNVTELGEGAYMKETVTDFTVKLGDALVSVGDNPFAMCRLAPFSAERVVDVFGGQQILGIVTTFDVSRTVRVIDGSLYVLLPNGHLELVTFAGDTTAVTVADNTARISAGAFTGAPVVQVMLPETLRSIGHKAFFGCDKLTMVYFSSYDAPILEEEYDYNYWISGENIPATGDYQFQNAATGDEIWYEGLGIVPYFMWNATDAPTVIYYGANFVDYVGRVENTVVMVHPVNGRYYDSFIYGNYFSVKSAGAAAPDATTKAAIAAINALPSTVTLADKAAVEAARAAYNMITNDTLRGLVTNYDKLLRAEQRIKDLEYINSGNQGGTEDTPDITPDGQNGKRTGVGLAILCGTLAGLVAGAAAALIVLYVLAKKGGGNGGNGGAGAADKEPSVFKKALTRIGAKWRVMCDKITKWREAMRDKRIRARAIKLAAATTVVSPRDERRAANAAIAAERAAARSRAVVAGEDGETDRDRKRRLVKNVVTASVGGVLALSMIIGIALAIANAGNDVYGDLEKNGFDVCIRFDANGGLVNETQNVTIVEVYSSENVVEKNGKTGHVILAPDDSARGQDDRFKVAMSDGKYNYIPVGWYLTRTPRTNENGEALDAFGELCSVSGRAQGYTYADKWDFKKDVVEASMLTDGELTLYQAWVPFFTYEFYSVTEDGATLITTKQKIDLTVPTYNERTGKWTMRDFPRPESGLVFDSAYLDEACTVALDANIDGDKQFINYENGTATETVIRVYIKWAEAAAE